MRQLIVESVPDEAGDIVLSGKLYRYVIQVLRMQTGMTIPVLLPNRGLTSMCIQSVDTAQKKLILHCCGADKDQPEPYSAPLFDYDIILLQWVLKGAKNDIVIRQATEAGVRIIMPISAEFSVAKKTTPMQQERHRRIIREARQQSGSPIPTAIMAPAPLGPALETISALVPAQTSFLGVCSESNVACTSLHRAFAAKPSHIVLAIGAEGGISPVEYEQLHKAGFQPIHFKTNILRAETAALYAIAATQTILNEAAEWQLPEYTC
ncbi:MAG: RsmE family RNA methyltransferase [Treponema sp.]